MTSLATACRGAVRLSSRSWPRNGPSRGSSTSLSVLLLERPSESFANLQLGFRSASKSLTAQNLTMPAMSPTMTEGNIASWKVKEGKGNACNTETVGTQQLIDRGLFLYWRCLT